MAKEVDLDDLSNSVADAIVAGNYQEAERLCQKLLSDFPKAFDGHQRMARIRRAQGRFQEAADHYDKVLEMIRKNPKGTDRETVQYVTELRDQALAKAKT